jgi:hypothetical protein
LYGQRGSFDSVRVGFEIGIYNPRRGRIAHITRAVALAHPLRKGRPAWGAWCIGTGATAGVHRTFYPASGIYAASNWLYKKTPSNRALAGPGQLRRQTGSAHHAYPALHPGYGQLRRSGTAGANG